MSSDTHMTSAVSVLSITHMQAMSRASPAPHRDAFNARMCTAMHSMLVCVHIRALNESRCGAGHSDDLQKALRSKA